MNVTMYNADKLAINYFNYFRAVHFALIWNNELFKIVMH